MDVKILAAQLRKPEGETGVNIGNTMNKGNAFMNSLVFTHLDLKDNESVLEIGFGNGKLIPQFLGDKKNVRYEGIDYSEVMVNQAIEFNKKLIDDRIVHIQQGNFCDLPFEDNTFDKVLTINTIYFLDDLLAGLKELFRVTGKGGSVYIGARPPETPNILEFAKINFTFYTPEKIVELLKTAGFSKVDFELQNDPPVIFQEKEVILQSMCIWGYK